MIDKDGVLENLKQLVGDVFDSDDVICAFEDFEENGNDYVIVEKSSNAGYDYIAYIDDVHSTQFVFRVDEENVIKEVMIIK